MLYSRSAGAACAASAGTAVHQVAALPHPALPTHYCSDEAQPKARL